jgi:hypothetical protein
MELGAGMEQNEINGRIPCARCGDVIGVYEPMVAILEGRPHKTSIAAKATSLDTSVECYHQACYDADGCHGGS